jgi:hypothetical protein
MRGPEEYEQFAEECVRLSRVVSHAQNRAFLVQMATTWLRLAELARERAQGEKV